jgi:hypothetical protein
MDTHVRSEREHRVERLLRPLTASAKSVFHCAAAALLSSAAALTFPVDLLKFHVHPVGPSVGAMPACTAALAWA